MAVGSRPTVAAGTCGPATRNPVASPDAHRVAGDLFADELVVRFVFVERTDHIVAIDPGVLAIQIRFRAVRFGPANHVQPVLCPAFAEVRRIEQSIDECRVGLLGILVICLEKVGRLFGRRCESPSARSTLGESAIEDRRVRENDKIVLCKAIQAETRRWELSLGSLSTWLDTSGWNVRHFRPQDRLKRPVIRLLFFVDRIHLAGPHGAFFDPSRQQLDLFRRESCLRPAASPCLDRHD